jgi:hypothetical protein
MTAPRSTTPRRSHDHQRHRRHDHHRRWQPLRIGYISLGSLNDTVKALQVDGADATVDNIKSGAYKVARRFNIATKGTPSDVAQDFIKYIMSAEGQAVIETNKYIKVDDNAAAYTAANLSARSWLPAPPP